ncbi:hypothetical protein [Novosphingobium gossypii]|uniref:hypothetical protein n=1 Tax=Novosphingobium gossypii TaxID=1604774 RepID=UPI003D2122F4
MHVPDVLQGLNAVRSQQVAFDHQKVGIVACVRCKIEFIKGVDAFGDFKACISKNAPQPFAND